MCGKVVFLLLVACALVGAHNSHKRPRGPHQFQRPRDRDKWSLGPGRNAPKPFAAGQEIGEDYFQGSYRPQGPSKFQRPFNFFPRPRLPLSELEERHLANSLNRMKQRPRGRHADFGAFMEQVPYSPVSRDEPRSQGICNKSYRAGYLIQVQPFISGLRGQDSGLLPFPLEIEVVQDTKDKFYEVLDFGALATGREPIKSKPRDALPSSTTTGIGGSGSSDAGAETASPPSVQEKQDQATKESNPAPEVLKKQKPAGFPKPLSKNSSPKRTNPRLRSSDGEEDETENQDSEKVSGEDTDMPVNDDSEKQAAEDAVGETVVEKTLDSQSSETGSLDATQSR